MWVTNTGLPALTGTYLTESLRLNSTNQSRNIQQKLVVPLHMTSEITRLKHINTPTTEFPITEKGWKGSRFIFRAISANFYSLFRIQMWFMSLGILHILPGVLLHVHSLTWEIWKFIGQRQMLMVTHIFILISVPFVWYNLENNNIFCDNINHTHINLQEAQYF